jgi:Dynamin family
MDVAASESDVEKLLRIASLAEQFNSDQIATEARTAAERISEGRFYVACVGQFKRGKSTLLNALIGSPILPSGIVPVTTVPTIVRFGEHDHARVRLQRGQWADIAVDEIEHYVSEKENPQNKKGVVGIEVFVSSELLAQGLCFVDTPGLGSVFEENTAATHAFLPHIDAAIAVIGADPPIAGDELHLLEIVSRQIQDIVFVLNKADRVTEEERAAAINFARQLLEERLQRRVPVIFQISALEQMREQDGQRDWKEFVNSLERLAGSSGRQLVREAGVRAVRVLSGQLLAVIKEECDALTRPFEESEKRIRQMRETVTSAAQSLNDLSFLFSGEQHRLSNAFRARRDLFLRSTRETAHRELDAALQSLREKFGPRHRRSAMQAAQTVARRHVLPWLESESKNAEEAYRGIAKRFTTSANDFLSRVRSLGTTELTYLPQELGVDDQFRAGSKFQFYEFIHVAMPASPVRYLADLMPGAHSRISCDAHEFLDRLLHTNSERVRNDVEDRVAENRRRLEAEIRRILQEVTVVMERALTRARSIHSQGAAAVESSLKRLADAEAVLARLTETRLSPLAHP